jgi:hypothetical protein
MSALITSRIDAITRIPPERMATVLPAPRSVKIELTAACSYRCSFCTRSLRDEKGEMDRAFYSRIIRELYVNGVEELGMFFIGESFTCPWLPDAIAEAKYVGFPYVFLTTNGAAATSDKVLACFKAGLDSLKFSLNFADADQLHDIAGVSPKNWRLALHNLKTAKMMRDEYGFKCGIYASSILFDDEQGVKMKALVETEIKPFTDETYWLPLYSMSGAAKAAGMKPQPGNPGRVGAMVPPIPCWSLFSEGHITANGLLAACCFGRGADDALAMADLNHTSFMEGWNCASFQALRKAHLDGDVSATACAECAAG